VKAMLTDAELVGSFATILGHQYVIVADKEQEPYLVDWRDRYHGKAGQW
jgi:hypothetical protein